MANKKVPNIGVHHLAVSVTDFEKSLKFYITGLGFEKVAEWGEGAGRAALLDIGNGSHLELFANGSKDEEKNTRFPHFAFATSDPDLAYNNAMAAGAASHMEPKSLDIPATPPMPVRIAFVKGPDGELLEFFKVL